MNGDGYSDILIGASSYNGNKGRAYLYYGNVSMNNVSDMIFKGRMQMIILDFHLPAEVI
ncbi:MAG: FG-GAP repeat protein [Ignavibacteria bacterium]